MMFSARRAFTLVEATVLVVVLALVTPPVAIALANATNARVDAVSAARAQSLADTVIEWIVADSESDDPDLGPDAFADAPDYIDASGGLRDRLAPVVTDLLSAGLSYSVTIGGLTNELGVATGDSAQDLYRIITVEVSAPSGSGAALRLQISTLVRGTSS